MIIHINGVNNYLLIVCMLVIVIPVAFVGQCGILAGPQHASSVVLKIMILFKVGRLHSR